MTGTGTPLGEENLDSRLSPRTQQVLALARTESDRLGQVRVDTGHLLLGLIRLDQGVAIQVLRRLGLNLDQIRQEVEKEIQNLGGHAGNGRALAAWVSAVFGRPTPRSGTTRGSPCNPYTRQVRTVLALADRESKNLDHHYLGTEHLLIGLLREGNGTAATVLARHNVDIEVCRQEILKELSPLPKPR